MYLQLAENNQTEKPQYIYIPQFLTVTPETPNGLPSGVNVREDYFDSLNNAEYNELMTILAPYQKGLSEVNLLSSRAERRARREARKEKRQQNKEERRANRREAFSKIFDTVGTVANRIFGGTPPEAPGTEVPAEIPKPWYQNPAVIVGGVVIIGGLVYLGMKKK